MLKIKDNFLTFYLLTLIICSHTLDLIFDIGY
jgi:hypothetical protein